MGWHPVMGSKAYGLSSSEDLTGSTIIGAGSITVRYVNEFTFRLNDGNCKTDTINRIKSLCSASAGKRLTYAELIGE